MVQQHNIMPISDGEVDGEHSCRGAMLASLFSLSFVRFEDK